MMIVLNVLIGNLQQVIKSRRITSLKLNYGKMRFYKAHSKCLNYHSTYYAIQIGKTSYDYQESKFGEMLLTFMILSQGNQARLLQRSVSDILLTWFIRMLGVPGVVIMH